MPATGGEHDPVIGVWWARTGQHDWPGLVPLLDAGERERLGALRRVPDRERFVLAATLARCAAGTLLGVAAREVRLERTCPRCGAPHGRPRVAAPAAGLELSITHSGDVAGVAACRGAAVGLDVELAGRLADVSRLAASVLAAQEQRALERAAGGVAGGGDREEAFLRLWTRKEALTKMLGTGITVPLSEVVVSGPDEAARCLALPDARPELGVGARPAAQPQPSEVALHDLDPPARGHVAAVAVARPDARPQVHDGDALLAGLAG